MNYDNRVLQFYFQSMAHNGHVKLTRCILFVLDTRLRYIFARCAAEASICHY